MEFLVLIGLFATIGLITMFSWLVKTVNKLESNFDSLCVKLGATRHWLTGDVLGVDNVLDRKFGQQIVEAEHSFCKEFNKLTELVGYNHVKLEAEPARYEFRKLKKSKKR